MGKSVHFQELADNSKHLRFPILMHNKQERWNDCLNSLYLQIREQTFFF